MVPATGTSDINRSTVNIVNTRSHVYFMCTSNESWSIEQRTFVYRKPVYSSYIGFDNREETAQAGQCPQYGKIKKCGRTYCSWWLRIQHICARSVKRLLSIGYRPSYRRGYERGYGLKLHSILCRWSEGFAHAIPIEITINLEVPRVVLRGWGGRVDLYSYRSSNKPVSVEHQADAYTLLFGNYWRTAIHAHNVYVL